MKRSLTAWAALAFALTACTAQQQDAAKSDAQQVASSAPGAAKDAYLVAAVATKLASIDMDSTTSVHPSSDGGVVTLAGQAKSAAQRAAYVRAAQSVNGVASVRDRLAVNPKLQGVSQQAQDLSLTARVSAAIAAQAGVNVLNLTITSHNGTVTLAGKIASGTTRSTIVATARSVSGVRAVVNHLTGS
jgi:hyperosmotically inducible protein